MANEYQKIRNLEEKIADLNSETLLTGLSNSVLQTKTDKGKTTGNRNSSSTFRLSKLKTKSLDMFTSKL